MTDGIDLHRIAPGTPVDLAAIDPVDGMQAPGDRDTTETAGHGDEDEEREFVAEQQPAQ